MLGFHKRLVPHQGPEFLRGTDGTLANATDAVLLAKAMDWAALNESCSGKIFNITNGDVFRWREIFPQVAEVFGIECPDPQTFSLTKAMRDQGPIWEALIKRMA